MSHPIPVQASGQSKTIKHTSLALRLVAAAAFLAAGGAKLMGASMMVEVFEHIGVGQWFRIVTGLVEVSAAIALLVTFTAGLGGLLLAITMVFAIFTHLFVIGGSPAPAVVLLLITASIAWLNRASLLNLVRLPHA
ncbi:DoxX family protein [Pseudomonas sp. Pse1]|uniref:DoxX family protein n=1 Tax=Pseudomonas sp. Pse1 TaxID=2926020 RepID=UPI002118F41D|nr:DoxX family protein [Pseudomonas sp. Pse1]